MPDEPTNPLAELTPPILEPPLEHTAGAAALSLDSLQSALQLHREQTLTELKAALREATLENARETANEIARQLRELETATVETPELMTGEPVLDASPGLTTLQMETPKVTKVKVPHKPTLIPIHRR